MASEMKQPAKSKGLTLLLCFKDVHFVQIA